MTVLHIIDVHENGRYIANYGRVVVIPRLKGITQIIAGKAADQTLEYYGLAYEVITEPAKPDDVLQDPQQVGGVWTTVWAPRTYTQDQIDDHRTMVLEQIDHAVEQWRIARTSPGNYIAAEYQIKREDAQAYLAAIITDASAPVPVTIQAVADRYQITPQAAAQTIIGRATILPAELRASAVIRDEQKGKAARAEEIAQGDDPNYVPASHEIIATLDQILADTQARLEQIPTV